MIIKDCLIDSQLNKALIYRMLSDRDSQIIWMVFSRDQRWSSRKVVKRARLQLYLFLFGGRFYFVEWYCVVGGIKKGNVRLMWHAMMESHCCDLTVITKLFSDD